MLEPLAFTSEDLLRALGDCFIPKTQRNIVAAGLVRSATLERDPEAPGAGISGVPPRFLARIALLAPGSDEAVNAHLRALIENRLLGIQAISRVEITLLPPLFSILS